MSIRHSVVVYDLQCCTYSWCPAGVKPGTDWEKHWAYSDTSWETLLSIRCLKRDRRLCCFVQWGMWDGSSVAQIKSLFIHNICMNSRAESQTESKSLWTWHVWPAVFRSVFESSVHLHLPAISLFRSEVHSVQYTGLAKFQNPW